MSDTPREAIGEIVELAVYPSEPNVGGYVRVETNQNFSVLHAIRSVRQDVNHQLLVLWFPSSHFYIRVNDRLDIVLNVLRVSTFVM